MAGALRSVEEEGFSRASVQRLKNIWAGFAAVDHSKQVYSLTDMAGACELLTRHKLVVVVVMVHIIVLVVVVLRNLKGNTKSQHKSMKYIPEGLRYQFLRQLVSN